MLYQNTFYAKPRPTRPREVGTPIPKPPTPK